MIKGHYCKHNMNFSYNTVAFIYDFIDKIFFRLGKNNPRKAIFNLIPNKPLNIIDICSGTGSNIIELAKEKPLLKITGIDNSEGMINIAMKKVYKYKLNNIKFILEDASNFDIQNILYDYAVISLILHEMDDITAYKVLKNTHKILKNNGKVIIFEFIIPDTNKFLPNLAFKLIKKVEDKIIFPAFLAKDKEQYFINNGFKIDNIHRFEYTIIYELRKL